MCKIIQISEVSEFLKLFIINVMQRPGYSYVSNEQKMKKAQTLSIDAPGK